MYRPKVLIVLLIFVIMALTSCSGVVGEPGSEMEAILEQAREPIQSNSDWIPIVETIDGVDMALVPAGCFMMGISDGFTPMLVHEQCFEEPFWIDVSEVTNAQYGSPGDFEDPDLPRGNVTWLEAAQFCQSRGTRLPTEAEWEYAARGPDGLDYPWGNQFNPENVVFQSNSGLLPAPVGSMPGGVSWVGAYDLAGNMAEWVSSQFLPYPYDPQDGREDTRNVSKERVLRGGAYEDDQEFLRAGNRAPLMPSDTYNFMGFRCALSLDSATASEPMAESEAGPTTVSFVATPIPLPEFSADGSWERHGYMKEKKFAMPVVEIDGLIYVPGGIFEGDSLQVFDPKSNEWQELARLPAHREFQMAAAYGGLLYQFGGSGQSEDFIGQMDTWVYDPQEDEWYVKAEMPEPRFRGRAVAHDGAIYIVGGLGGSDAVLQYDPVQDTWQRLAGMGGTRWAHDAVLADGKIYVIGGSVSGPEWASVELTASVKIFARGHGTSSC